MEILSVTLKNFKAHRDRHFVFQPGTNAICGENGAGKTSILEAIAWVLFNHRGGYRTEDLIRNGAASAQASVTFLSNQDHRTYTVHRCTRAGYTLYDPQLDTKLEYSRIEEDVLPWLRHHLGAPVGTDLADLFASTIGVPQGTFTADFLKAPKERKHTFDAILKVEEYRQTADQLLTLEKYARAEVEGRERAIAQYEEALKDWQTLWQKHQDLHQEIGQYQTELQQWQQQLVTLQAQQEQLAAQATQMQQVTAQGEKLAAQAEAQAHLVQRAQSELEQVEQAVAICTAHRESYQAFLQAEAILQDLDQQRAVQQILMQQRQEQREKLAAHQTQQATLAQQLERLADAEAEIQRLQPRVQQQTTLEQHQQALMHQWQECQTWKQTLSRETKRLAQLKARQQQLDQELAQLAALKPVVAQIPQLEEQQQRYQQQLSRIAAAAQFETDLRQIVTQAQQRGQIHNDQIVAAANILKDLQQAVPLWANPVTEVLTTLEQGANLQNHLMANLQAILDDLAEQVLADRIQQHLHQVQTQLKTAQQQQARFLTLEAKTAEQQALIAEIGELETTLTELQTRLAPEAELQRQQTELATHLAELGDPRGRSRLLQQELQDQPLLIRQFQQVQQVVTQMETAIAQVDQQLAAYADLTTQVQTQQQTRETHRTAYQHYLEHQQLANSRRQRQQQLQAAAEQLQQLEAQREALLQQQALLAETYDRARFQAIQQAYQKANDQCIALTASLPQMQQRLEELAARLQALEAIQTQLKQAQAELKQRQQAERFIKFARKTYKEAGPRITERYVQTISREADRLFRELLNRPNVALEWTRDYEIVVQESAHSRRFINLSGGEQMCAALAVRLALLKVLADINIAFFDEPTTNMDRQRRRQLAEAISNLKTFHQLFVISHDDTFEQVTENIIYVERET